MLAELEVSREGIIEEMVGRMPDEHKELLLGFKRGAPDWSLLGIDHVPTLPGILWKQRNLDKLDPARRATLVKALEHALGMGSGNVEADGSHDD